MRGLTWSSNRACTKPTPPRRRTTTRRRILQPVASKDVEQPRPEAGQAETGLTATTNTIGMRFVLVPAGEFLMGSSREEFKETEGPEHKVQISKPFLLGIHEVTQGQYESVTGANPGHFAPRGGGAEQVRGEDTRRLPVESVSWFDAVEFCNALSLRENLKPYYRAVNRSLGDVEVLGGAGYRLPTEAEWEYACRAGFTSDFCFGGEWPEQFKEWHELVRRLGEYSWHSENSDHRTHPVGSKLPNRFGLYDMNGNVSEWVWDRYDRGLLRSVAGDRSPRTREGRRGVRRPDRSVGVVRQRPQRSAEHGTS